uniref:Transmembrane serine protease 4 n=1 Tax=Anas platyrhynchos platyrhynchos TaxID=8840 RepID=A0A493SX16_ANAPP
WASPSTRPKTCSVRRFCMRVGIPVLVVVLSLASPRLPPVKAYLEYHYFFCKQPLRLLPLARVCDGEADCLHGEDEASCPQHVPEGPQAGARVSRDRSILQVLNRNTGAWSCVCYDHFNLALAKAACEQMGYSRWGAAVAAPLTFPPCIWDLPFPPSSRKCLSGSVVSLVCSSCGESARTPRVLGGRPAAIEWWPWQVSLQYRTEHICGGSVIEPGWILTAAHCFKNNPVIPNWRVKAGSDLLSGSVTLAVEKVFLAEVTPPSPKDNDIALVKLQSPLQVSGETIKPICLPYFDEELVPGTSLWVTGWGYTKEHGERDGIEGCAPGGGQSPPAAPFLPAPGSPEWPRCVLCRETVGDPAAGGGEAGRHHELQPGCVPRGGDGEDAVRRRAAGRGGHLPGEGWHRAAIGGLLPKEGAGSSPSIDKPAPGESRRDLGWC